MPLWFPPTEDVTEASRTVHIIRAMLDKVTSCELLGWVTKTKVTDL